jgi:hypothetical protein
LVHGSICCKEVSDDDNDDGDNSDYDTDDSSLVLERQKCDFMRFQVMIKDSQVKTQLVLWIF